MSNRDDYNEYNRTPASPDQDDRDSWTDYDDFESGYPEDDRDGYYPEDERNHGREEYYPEDERSHDRDGYRAGYRDGFRDNATTSYGRGRGRQCAYDMEKAPKESFRKRHPIVMHLIYASAAAVLAVWMALWFLDFWTFHGQERAVPDVKGQSLTMAEGNISRAGLKAVVTDSVYDSYARPGTVVEQSPIPLAKIKRGGTVYLTLVAFTPKMVTIPDFYDVSERQARSMLEGLGITQVMTVTVPSEYAGLVMGAKFNGVSLRPGAKVPVTAVITLEVGGGMADISPTGEIVDTAAIEEAIEVLNID